MTRPGDLPCPPPDAAPRAPVVAVPQGACDCHVHVFGPADRYPYQDERAYTPPDAPPEALFAMHAALGLSRAVIVQASVHGTDNAAVVDAVARAPERLRGVVSVREDVTDAALERWHASGIRGIRLNMVDRGGMPFRSLDDLAAFSGRLAGLGWHVEFLAHVEAMDDLSAVLPSLRVPAVFGHLGYTRAALGPAHPGYRRFLALARDHDIWVKLTGPYRISGSAALPYADVAPFAQALADAIPDRLLWGSDWPHVMLTRPMPNDGALLDLLGDWLPDPDLRRRVLVDNPARLYGFARA